MHFNSSFHKKFLFFLFYIRKFFCSSSLRVKFLWSFIPKIWIYTFVFCIFFSYFHVCKLIFLWKPMNFTIIVIYAISINTTNYTWQFSTSFMEHGMNCKLLNHERACNNLHLKCSDTALQMYSLRTRRRTHIN
jgi:hypothetical protein